MPSAIHHTLAAGDTRRAAKLIEAHFDTVFNLRGEEATIQRWLPALPDELVRSRPRLLLAMAQMAAMRGDIETMEPLIDAAEDAAVGASDEPFEPTAGKAGSLLVNVPAVIALQRSYAAQLRGDPDGTAVHTARAVAEVGEGERMLSSAVEGFLAMADWLRGRLAEAEVGFASNISDWIASGQPTTTAWGNYSLARIQRAQGRLDAAEQTCRRSLEFAAGPGREPLPAAGPAFVVLGDLAYQRNDLDAAVRCLADGIPLCRQFVHTPPLAAGLVTLAWIRQLGGDPAGALDAVDEAERLSPGPAGLLNPVPAQVARLLLAQGDVAAAERWTETCGLTDDEEPAYPREPGQLVLARVLLARGQPSRAIALLDRLHAAASAQRRIGSLIEVGAVRALALAADGAEADALTALTEVLALACPRGYVRVFTDEGASMAALLGRLIAAQRTGRVAAEIPFGCLVTVHRSFLPAEPTRDEPAAPTGLVEALTARELEVLELMSAGKSNRAIAAELVVSIDTVKKHVSHILDKLGANNRTEAVRRGRELGLST